MTTTVIKTIGTGGDYSTLQAWEDACPADLTAVDQIWRGECLNQEFVVSSTALYASGVTTSSTQYMELTTAAGASFRDHASKATNPLRYNASVGAAIRNTGGYSYGVRINVQYFRLSNLQIKTASQSYSVMAGELSSGAYATIENCILENDGGATEAFFGNNATLKNSVVISFGGSKLAFIGISGSWYNSILIHLGTGSAVLGTSYPSGTVRNCYIGGNITALPTLGSTIQNNKTSLGSPPSGFTTAALDTTNFVNVTSGTHDLSLAAGSALINAGTDDATNAATDILGTARTSGAYDVGPKEYAAGGGGGTHAATGSLSSSAATLAGTSARAGSAVTHAATATLVAGSATLSGTASHATSGSFVSDIMVNNTGTVQASVSVTWEWNKGVIGSAKTSTIYGTGTTSGTGTYTATGLPSGNGFLLATTADGSVYYQTGTVV